MILEVPPVVFCKQETALAVVWYSKYRRLLSAGKKNCSRSFYIGSTTGRFLQARNSARGFSSRLVFPVCSQVRDVITIFSRAIKNVDNRLIAFSNSTHKPEPTVTQEKSISSFNMGSHVMTSLWCTHYIVVLTGRERYRRYRMLCHVCRNLPNFLPQYLFLRASNLFWDDSYCSYFAMFHIAQYPSKYPSSFSPASPTPYYVSPLILCLLTQ